LLAALFSSRLRPSTTRSNTTSFWCDTDVSPGLAQPSVRGVTSDAFVQAANVFLGAHHLGDGAFSDYFPCRGRPVGAHGFPSVERLPGRNRRAIVSASGGTGGSWQYYG